MLPRVLFLLPVLTLAGCAVPTSRSNVIVVTENQVVVASCKRLGLADGAQGVIKPLLRDLARDSALARLKVLAAEAEGTHVLSGVAALSWKGPDTTGTIYRC